MNFAPVATPGAAPVVVSCLHTIVAEAVAGEPARADGPVVEWWES